MSCNTGSPETASIVLSTLNARYSHCAFGLRYLQANMGDLAVRTRLLEFDIRTPTSAILAKLAEAAPAILGLGVYIWNAARLADLLPRIRAALPDTKLILGGPEVSYDPDPAWLNIADGIVSGEADLAFAEVCRDILAGAPLREKTITAPAPDLAALKFPYALYTEEDIRHRTIYVETSRGCPFDCEYCLSSREPVVRYFPLPDLFAQFDDLLRRGVRRFKFVDRALNLQPDRCAALLDYFRQRYEPGLFLHVEMMPDRFPSGLKDTLRVFPAGALQVEVGIQTLNPEVARRIRRRQDMESSLANLHFLREETGVYIHADLIAGLPGETPESLAAGFDRLAACRPHEIQFGILKRLRGTAIGRHDVEWLMRYNPEPPYNLLDNRLLDAGLMRRLERFARYWDKVSNSGRFRHTVPLLARRSDSVFESLLSWSDWVFAQTGKTHGMALNEWAAQLFRYLTEELRLAPAVVTQALLDDFAGRPLRDIPVFLRPPSSAPLPVEPPNPSRGRFRQNRHFP